MCNIDNDQFKSNNYTHMLICGDFNLPGIKWKDGSTDEGKTEKLFMECFRDCFLYQHVTEPTHHRGDQTPNILDLILTNEEEMIDDISVESPLGKSHHSLLSFKLKCYRPSIKINPPRFVYEKANWEAIRKKLVSTKWTDNLQGLSVEDTWSVISNTIKAAMDSHIPKTKPDNRNNNPKWINKEVKEKVRQKRSAYKKYMQTREGNDYALYARARNQAKWACRKAVRDMERNIAEESKTNPKAFFKYANSKLKLKCGIADLKNDDGSVSSTDKEKAEALNRFFCSVFTKENTDKIPEPTNKPNIVMSLSTIKIEPDDIIKKLSKLNPSKACGPDCIPPAVLKHCAEELALPLSILMNQSINEGTIPYEWKIANVTPIFKKGKKTCPSNYRPVSLTSVTCKIMESIIRDRLIHHLEESNLLNDCQHGFVRGRSCSTNLLAVLDQWTKILDEGGSIDTIYLDFAKAFDTVPHERLLRKLQGYGIEGHLLSWTKDFLSGRKQRVVVNGEESQWGEVLSGIPQGSVLGPLLFVCFVNDLPDDVKTSIFLFADDTKVFAKVPDESLTLQDDLDKLQQWSDSWQLKFNAEKCKVMHIGKNSDHRSYTMMSKGVKVSLETIKLEKDLGVNFDEGLNFKQHVYTQVEKANKLLALLRRGFTALDIASLSTLYKSIIRPHLEYGNVVWHPKLKETEELLESVQRRTSRLIPELRKLDYTDRLKKLNLPSLYYRRARGDMIECYKYLSKIYNVPSDFLSQIETTKTRGHSLKLKKPSVKTSVRQNFFSVRVVNSWNSLPEDVVSAPTLNSFKNRLDKVWSGHKFTLSSDWFKTPPHASRKQHQPRQIECENLENEVSSYNDNNRLIGD